MTRPLLILTFLLASLGSASAATIHRTRPSTSHLFAHRLAGLPPGQRAGEPRRFAVPGWSDGQTQYWLDNATAAAGLY